MKRKKIATTTRGPLDDSNITSNRFVQAAMLEYLASTLIHPDITDEWAEMSGDVVSKCFKAIGLSEDAPEPLYDTVFMAILDGSHAMHTALVAAGHLRTDREEWDRFYKEQEARECSVAV